jgi:hypothetical protein
MKERFIVTAGLWFSMLLVAFAQKDSAPAARSGYSMAYDENRGAVVLFGGQDSASARLNDTWEWRKAGWARINIPGPPARMNAAMAYDANQKLVLLFGGRSESGPENDLWAYDG